MVYSLLSPDILDLNWVICLLLNCINYCPNKVFPAVLAVSVNPFAPVKMVDFLPWLLFAFDFCSFLAVLASAVTSVDCIGSGGGGGGAGIDGALDPHIIFI